MANWYVSSTRYTAVAQWAASTAYTVGQIVRQLATTSVGNERCFRCTTAGTSGSSEPSWNLTKSSTTADGTAVWTEITGNASYNGDGGGTAWAAPFARLQTANTWAGTAGANVYVANDHAETQAATMTLTLQGVSSTAQVVVSINPATIPPTGSTVSAGASITTTGSNGITIDNTNSGNGYLFGITFNCGTGSSSPSILVNSSPSYLNQTYFENCSFNFPSTGFGGPVIGNTGGTNGNSYTEFRSCTFTFGGSTQTIEPQVGKTVFIGCTFAASGTLPTYLITTNYTGIVTCSSCDFSAITGTIVKPGSATFDFTATYCKVNSGATLVGTYASAGVGSRFRFHYCDSGATNYAYSYFVPFGEAVLSTSTYRSGGFSDGTTGQSWKINSSSSAYTWLGAPFVSEDMAVWNDTVGSVNAKVYLTSSVALTNAQVWLEVDYLGSSSSPLGTTTSSRVSNVLVTGTSLTTDTSTWTGAQTYKYVISVPISPAQKGVVKARLYVAGVTTAFYLDPALTVA